MHELVINGFEMLTRSWVLFEGVGDVTEAKLWSQGLHDWTDDRCFDEACRFFPKLTSQSVQRERALKALKKKDVRSLSESLPQNEQWRLWELFGEDAVFVDIETNGLGSWAKITVLGTYFRGKYRAFINGRDLDQAWVYLNQASLVVTFNGKQFDVPFIERHFEESLELPHIDLRFVAASLGYRGGLKKIEPQFGIERTAEIKAVNGYEAVALWKRFERGDERALKLLIDYNQADVEGLPHIMSGCWDRKLDERKNGIRN